MSTTRYPFGVTNVVKQHPLGMMGQLDPSKFHSLFDDFDRYAAADWVITDTGISTHALVAGDGGLLQVATAAAANDASFYQQLTAAFLMGAGKKAFFKTRLKVANATNAVLQTGLIVATTTPLTATDGIFFQKDTGDTHLDVYCQKDTTTGKTSKADVAELANDTFVELGFYYDGESNVYFYVNSALVAKLDASSTYLPDAALALSFGVVTGGVVAETLTMDYIFAAKER